MRWPTRSGVAVLAVPCILAACDSMPIEIEPGSPSLGRAIPAASQGNTFLGDPVSIGAGEMRTYAHIHGNGTPQEIGLVFSHATLSDLPEQLPTLERCLDLNGDGGLDTFLECAGGVEYILEMPTELSGMEDVPIEFVMVNFNPFGHVPPGVYDVRHFDMHFYTTTDEERRNIRLGYCAEVIDCDDFAVATLPLEPEYMPEGHTNVGAAVGEMGNHLLDLSSPEHHGTPFTHTWIWGTYGAEITFLEPMITVEYLLSEPQRDCTELKMPQRFHKAGYYPAQYCIGYNRGQKEFTVSLERFSYFPG